LTIGVDNRVEQLASHPKGFKIKYTKPFYRLLPLHEVLSLGLGSPLESKKVWGVYNSLISEFGNEFNILLHVPREEFVKKNVDEKITELIIRNRNEKIKVQPGFDGEYGKAVIGAVEKQVTLV
jgi:PHP family Zn ribbon phosphoesterase